MTAAEALDQEPVDIQSGRVERLNLPPQASHSTQPKSLSPAADPLQQPSIAVAEPSVDSTAADALLLIFADALDDLERVRIATENRVRSLVQVKGMEGTPEQARLEGLCDGLRAMEHGAELELKRALRTHPLGPWVKRTIGIGEKQGARLLAAIGDPASRKMVSQLHSYCGYDVLNPGHAQIETQTADAGVQPLPADQNLRDTQATYVGRDPSSDTAQGADDTQRKVGGVAPSRTRGQKANWNATAKMRAFLVAESCIKQRTSPYRLVYDNGREKYADSLHDHECVRCGPSGKPAAVGSPLSLGHQHARAMRLVAKEVLKDLWTEAKALAS